jgi:hypothetical protein
MSSTSKEGYLLIDNRASEGSSGIFESATYTCNHCHAIVVKNQNRTRERGYCRGCNSVICDACAAIRAKTLQCVTFDQVIDKTLTAAEKRADVDSPILLL